MLLNAFRRLFSNSQNRKARRASSRPQLLQLESRIVPATFTVLNTNDAFSGSLRQAIIDANATAGDDIINFNITGTITLHSQNNTVIASLPTILDANLTASGGGGTVGTLTINGPGASSLIISGLDGGNTTRDFNIFNIDIGGDLTISGVTVSGAQKTSGGFGQGGGGFNNFGTLTVSNSIISGNTAGTGGGIDNSGTLAISNSTLSTNNAASRFGGGILNTSSGTLTVTNSTFSGNFAQMGGGILHSSSGTLTVTNSTFSGNFAQNGGGIFNDRTFTVTNSTISGNTATSFGGGIFNNNSGTLNIANTIIANSISSTDFFGTAPSTNTNNLVETLTVITGTFTPSFTADPILGLLQNNGGPTFTMALGANSVAISTTPLATPNLDQRGFIRTNNDIGAYAYYATPTVASISPNSASTAGGTSITITGTNFVAGPNVVTIDGVAATNVNFVSATSITATTPAGTAGSPVSVVVTSAGGNSAANTLFTYGTAPIVTSSTNSLAINSTTLTIAGSGFDPVGSNTVTFNNGAVGTVASASANSLTVNLTTLPSTIGSLTATVTSFGVASTTVQVATIVAAPTVTLSTTNNLAINATTLTIAGTGFNTTAGNNLVTFSSGTGTVTSATTTQLTVTFATAPSLGNLTAIVTSFGGASTSVQVATIVAAPTTTTLTSSVNPSVFSQSVTFTATVAVTSPGTVTATGSVQFFDGQTSLGIVNLTSGSATSAAITNFGVGTHSITAVYSGSSSFVTSTSSAVSQVVNLGIANTPTFGTTTSTANGFTVQISNYDVNFTYGGTATAGGTVAISNTGLVTVTGVAANTSSIAIITTTRTNYVSGSGQVTATSLAPTAPLITGTPPPPSSGGSSRVNLYNTATGQPTGTAVPFPGFNGPVKVVSGDFNNDGVADIIAGAGFGGGPAIAILNSQTGEVMESFFAFDPAFTGGVFVAVKDVNGDGILDIIAGAGPGGGPEVRIFDGASLNVLRAFFAYDQSFTGGVSVATIDFNGDGILDLVTGAGPGGAPHVKVYDGATNAIISQWFAYPVSFTGGVFVAVGDIGNDGNIEVVTGAGQGGAPVVAVWNPANGAPLAQFMAYSESFTGGVRVGINDGNGDGTADIITGAGPGGGPQVNVFSFPALDLLFSFYSGDATNKGGVFVS